MKACPHCGAQISDTAKFCSECGYNVGGDGAAAKALHKDFWIKLIPNMLFFVFAVSLFGVLAEPVISGLICANVYLLCDSAVINDTAISMLSILLVIFVVLTVIAAIVTAAVKYVAYKDGKPVNCKTDWISFACYMLYLLVGFILCVIIASYDGLFVGACPVWLIILPIIFTCLLGAIKAYIKYGATAPAATNIKPIDDDKPSNKQSEQAEIKDTLSKKEKSDSDVAPRQKRSKALLPAILFLAFAAVMWISYSAPSIRVLAYNNGEPWRNFYFSVYDINFFHINPVTETFINIFQYVLIGYLSVVTIAAVVLLIQSIVCIKKDGSAGAKVCGRALLVTLILYSIYFVIAWAWLLFTMMARRTWFEVGCIAIISVAAIGFIGTIIAMVKTKKKRNKEAAENLE